MTLKYDVILADPPWNYEVYDKDTGNGRSPSAHYQTMTLEALCALPIRELAADNCALFLWSVWPSLLERYDDKGKLLTPSFPSQVMKAWGFRYATLGFEWVKLNKSGMGFFMGMGFYTRCNSEPCILGVRGKMPVADKGERNLIVSPVREHSRKPDEQYAKIEKLYPNKRYVELFARKRRPGWDAFGNEVEGSIILPSLVA